MPEFDADRLERDLVDTASAVLGRDVTQDRGWTSRPARRLVETARQMVEFVAGCRSKRQARDQAIDAVEEDSVIFVHTLRDVPSEASWRLHPAIEDTVLRAISDATGVTIHKAPL